MTWLKEIFGLEENLDAVAHTKLNELGMLLGRLNSNLSHLKVLLKKIEKNKKEGEIPKVAIRENFMSTLGAIESETFHALKLEQKVEATEKKVVYEEKGNKNNEEKIIKIPMSAIKQKGRRGYTIGSSDDCDLIVEGAAPEHVWIGEDPLRKNYYRVGPIDYHWTPVYYKYGVDSEKKLVSQKNFEHLPPRLILYFRDKKVANIDFYR